MPEPAEVDEVALRRLDGRRRVRGARLLVTGDSDLRVQRRQTVQRSYPVVAALRRGIAHKHVTLVVEDVAADDEVDRWYVQGGAVSGISAALLDDAEFVAFEGEGFPVIGLW